MSSYFIVLGQVGATLFALMLATVQVSRDMWRTNRLRAHAMVSSLAELFAVMLVGLCGGMAPEAGRAAGVWHPLADAAPHLLLAVGCLAAGGAAMWALRRHRKAFDEATERERIDLVQHGWLRISMVVYPLLMFVGSNLLAIAVGGIMGMKPDPAWPLVMQWVALLICLWLVFSGSVEAFYVLYPEWDIGKDPRPDPRWQGPVQAATLNEPKHRLTSDRCSVFTPARGAPQGSVVLCHEMWGHDAVFLRLAQRAATELGCVVVAPRFYDRQPPRPWEVLRLLRAGATGKGDAYALLLESIQEAKRATPGKPVGLVGVSVGGELALNEATRPAKETGLAFVVACYPGVPRPLRESDPMTRRFVGDIPVHVFLGACDQGVEVARQLLLSAGLREEMIHEFAGAGHSFLNDEQSAPKGFVLVARLASRQRIGPHPAATVKAFKLMREIMDEAIRAQG